MKKIPDDLKEKLIWRTKFGGETLPFPYVDGFNHQPKICEDCNKVVINRRKNGRVNKHNKVRWSCENCKMYKNPDTGVYDMTSQELMARDRVEAAALKRKENKKTK